MRLKNIGNLSSLQTIFTDKGSNDALKFFETLDNAIQKNILSSGKLTENQLNIIKGSVKWNEGSDGIKRTISGLTEAEFEAAIATGQVSASQVAATGTTTGLSAAFTGLKATIVSIAPAILAITAACAALYAAYKYANAYNDALDRASDSQSTYSQTAQELESMNSELQTTQERLTELQALSDSGTITLAEERELEKLQLQNAELERQIKLKQELADKQSEQAVDDAMAALAYERTYDTTQIGGSLIDETGQEVTFKKKTGLIEATQNEIEKLQELTDKKNDLLKNNGTDEELQAVDAQITISTEKLKAQIEQANTLRQNFIDPITNGMKEGLTPSEIKAYEDLTAILDDFSNINLTPMERQLNKLNKFFDGSKGKNAIKTQLSNRYREIEQIFNEENQSLIENIQNEKQKISDWGLDEYSDSILNQTVQSKFGNVDMDKRTIINWSKELKETYKNALDSWDYDPEIGSIDTVFGGSDRFGEGVLEKGVEVAFTPIMNGELLDKNTVYDYINDLVGEATIDGKFSEERLLSLDKQGKQIGDTFISGLIAAADAGLNYDNNGNWAEVVGRLMHFSGKYGAISIAYKNIDKAAKKAGVSTSDFVDILSNSSDSAEALENELKSMGLTLDDIGVDSIDTLKRYLDEAKSSAEGVAETMKTLSDTESIGAVTKALETDDAGANYEKAVSSAEKIRELLDQGLVGKDEFKAFSDYLSYGMDDSYEAYQNGIDKFNRYFTTDSSSGVQNFINDLVAKSDELGTSWAKVNEAGDGWVFNVDNTAKAAKEMGISVGMIEDIFGRLQDYGFEIDWHSALSDLNTYSDALSGIKDIYDDMGDTVSKDRLGKLLGNWDEEFLGFQQDLSTLTDEQIVKIKFEYDKASLQLTIDEVKNDIEGGDKSVENYAQYYSANKQYIDISKSTLGLDKEGIQLPVQITGAETELNQLISMMRATNDPARKVELQAEITNKQELIKSILNDFSDQHPEITPDTDVDTVNNALADYFSKPQHLYVDAELKSEDVKDQLAQMSEGSTITFNAEINGVIEQVEAIKNEDGTITYSTVINGEPTAVILHKDGTITYQVNEVQGTQVDTPEGPYERVVNEVPGEQVETVDDATGVANFTLGESVKEVPAALGLANFILGSYPKSLPPIYQTVYQNVVRQRATGSMFAPAHATGTTGYNVVNTVSGSAYANGQVSLPYNERALVNELGRESFIRDGKWMLLPPGMHLQDFKKGDIILSASQTEALMKYGRASGKGNAYANGTIPPSVLTHAYAGGMNGGGSFKGGASSYNPNGGGSSSTSTSNYTPVNVTPTSPVDNKELDESVEKLDWIEILLSRIQRTITNLGKTVSATFKSWTKRNTALADEIAKINEEISLQQQAYNRYLQEAESVALSEDYKQLIRDGKIEIETISDEDLKKQIQDFQEFYEKALDCQDAIQDLQQNLADLAATKFDGKVQEYDDRLSTIEHQMNMLEGAIDKAETQGYLVSASYYKAMIDAENQNLSVLAQKRDSLIKTLDDAMQIGQIEKYSEQWYEMQSEINDVDEAIQEANISIIEFNNSIRQLEWDVFDRMQDTLSGIQSEADFLIELMSNDKMFNTDTGAITKEGQATLGLHAVNLNAYMSQADDYAKEIQNINEQLAKDPYNLELLDRRKELLESQRDLIQSAEDEKQAIKGLVSDGYDVFLDIMDKAIDKRKSWLNTVKDLYEYERKVAEQTKEISTLEKQLQAYSGDNSEASRANIQQIKVKLEEARQNLKDTEYDQYISDQERMLSDLYSETEEWINTRLDDLDGLIQGVIDSTNANASEIKDTLVSESESVGMTISSDMMNIWSPNGEFASVITTYGNDFSSKLTTTNDTLEKIRQCLAQMVGESDEQAKEEQVQIVNPPTPQPEPTPAPQPETEPEPTVKEITIGGQINAGNAPIYSRAGSTTGYSQYFDEDPVYTVLDEKDDYLLVRHHSVSSGYTGWFKKSDVKAYKTGGLVDYTGLAWVDGTKSNPETVLDAEDTKNFLSLKDALEEVVADNKTNNQTTKNKLALTQEDDKPEVIIRPSDGSILTPVKYDDSILKELSTKNIFALTNNPGKFMDNLGNSLDSTHNILNSVANNNTTNQSNIVINVGGIVMNGVNDPEEFENQLMHQLKNNPRVENIVIDTTLGRALGRNPLSKMKY